MKQKPYTFLLVILCISVTGWIVQAQPSGNDGREPSDASATSPPIDIVPVQPTDIPDASAGSAPLPQLPPPPNAPANRGGDRFNSRHPH